MNNDLLKICYVALALLLSVGNPVAAQGTVDSLADDFLPLDSLLNISISTASRHWQRISEAPASISIVTNEQIKTYGYETIAEALTSLSGFYSSNDRNYTYIGVRGFGRPTDYNNRIVFLLNGHPINENIYGGFYAGNDGPLNLHIAQRIEVVRGPGSVMYGTGAMFSVINLVTESGRSLARAEADAVYGSLGKRRVSVLYGGVLADAVDVTLTGVWGEVKGADIHFPEYEQPGVSDGIARELDWERYYSVFGRARYGNGSLQALILSREKGIPTGAYGILFNDPSAQTKDVHYHLGLDYEIPVMDDLRLTTSWSYDRYRYDGTFPYAETSRDGSIGEWVIGDLHGRWDLTSRYSLSAGAEVRFNPQSSYWNILGSDVLFDRNAPYETYSVYLQNEYQFHSSASIVLGGRWDGYSNGDGAVTPRLGLVVNPSLMTTVKVLYGAGYRTANFYERWYEDASSRFVRGGDLDPERISIAEIIVEQRIGEDFFLSVSGYHQWISNLIDQTYIPADSSYTFRNVQTVNAKGVEVGFQYHLATGVSGYANYAYQHPVEKERREILTNTPTHLLKYGCAYRSGSGLSLSGEIFYETSRRTLQDTQTSAFWLANAVASYQLIRETLGIALKVRNVFNRRYSLPGGYEHVQPAFEQDGRTIECRLEWNN